MKKTIFMWLMGLCAMGALSASAQTAASSVQGKKHKLFLSDSHKTTPYRIPAIVTLNDGTILALSDYRPDGKDVGGGDVEIYAKYGTVNTDGSYSWTPTSQDPATVGLEPIITDGKDDNYGYGDPAVAVDPETGHILVLSVGGNAVFGQTKASGDYKTMRHVSTDNGATWSTTEITSQFKGSNSLLKDKDVCSMFFASGRLLVSSYKAPNAAYNRIYGALLTSENASKFISWSDDNYNYVFYTDDLGATWSLLGGACISEADEAKVEELPNGDILISSRTTSGRIFNVYDMSEGKWGTQQTYTFASNCKATNGELLMYRGVTDVKTNAKVDILLQSLPIAENRSKVSVFYTVVDENSTLSTISASNKWTKGIQVYDAESAYSAMTIMPNGEIGFFYEEDYFSSNSNDNKKSGYAAGGTANMVFIPLTVSEITGGAYTYVAESNEPQTPTVAAPIITPNGGNIFNTQEITLNCATEGAFVYYTIDGTEPSANSTLYTQPFTLSESATVKAIAMKEDYNDSKVTSVTFNVTKAYRFKNVQKDGTCYYFTYDATNGIGLTTDVEEAALYARGEGTTPGTYTFQTIDGNYLIFSGRDLSDSNNRGYNDGKGFLAVYESAKCDLTVASLVTGGNVESFEGAYYTIRGQRDYKKNWATSTIQEQAYFVITNGGKFDGSNEPYFNSDYSSAFMIEEVKNESEAKKVATPVFSPASGTYEKGTEITITCATEGAKIYLALDPGWPAEEWVEYFDGMLEIGEDFALYAIAKLEGWEDSDMASAEYTVILPTVPTPVINPNGGKIESGDKITITCSDANANIYFTIDGTEPTENSIVYKSGFTLDADAIVKAIAVRNGFANSEVAVAEFTVNEINEVAVNFEKGYYNGFTSYMSTFSAPFDVTIPSSVKVYVVKRATSTNANLTRLYNTNIPANTGVVLKASKAGEVIIPEAKEGVTLANVSGNILIPTADGEVVLDSYAYVFGKNNSNKYAFYQKGAGEVVPQYRAYFVLNTAKAYVLELLFDDEDADPTAIEDVDVDEDVLNQESVIYDLSGRKVNTTRPGQIYIKNGKKFLAK